MFKLGNITTASSPAPVVRSTRKPLRACSRLKLGVRREWH